MSITGCCPGWIGISCHLGLAVLGSPSDGQQGLDRVEDCRAWLRQARGGARVPGALVPGAWVPGARATVVSVHSTDPTLQLAPAILLLCQLHKVCQRGSQMRFIFLFY